MSKKFKAGTYYIGDPCYVVSNDYWMDFIDAMERKEQIFETYEFFSCGTKYGDGTYTDSNGNEYMVDSGTIGVIPIDLVNRFDKYNSIGGQIKTFNDDFNIYNSGDKLEIDDFYILFKDEYYEDDLDEDYSSSDYYDMYDDDI